MTRLSNTIGTILTSSNHDNDNEDDDDDDDYDDEDEDDDDVYELGMIIITNQYI